MNPGKMVETHSITQNLRLGINYNPVNQRLISTTPATNSALRTRRALHGRGQVPPSRRGTMCPSYMVTREEMHSTRGRAHLLFEMLEGNPLDGRS
jgi:hypothetical protein